MIETVRAYIKTIAEFLFFIMIIRLISTEKSRKYVNFASSIVLILIAFGPVINLISDGSILKEDLFNISAQSYNIHEQYSDAETLNTVFKKQLEQSVKNDVESLGFECLNADVDVGDDFYSDGSIKKIEVIIKNGEGADGANSYLKNRYGAEQVNIIYQ